MSIYPKGSMRARAARVVKALSTAGGTFEPGELEPFVPATPLRVLFAATPRRRHVMSVAQLGKVWLVQVGRFNGPEWCIERRAFIVEAPDTFLAAGHSESGAKAVFDRVDAFPEYGDEPWPVISDRIPLRRPGQ